jgi:hypothetical protein
METIEPPIDAYLNINVAPGDDPNLSSPSIEDKFDKIALSQVPMKIALSQVPMAISATWPKVVAMKLEDGEAARSQNDAESREWVKFDILVAPWVQGNSITVVFAPSKQTYHLWLVVEDSGVLISFEAETSAEIAERLGAVNELGVAFHSDNPFVFVLSSDSPFRIAVGNAEGGISIPGGPLLEIGVLGGPRSEITPEHGNPFHLLLPQSNGMVFKMEGAVRANAIVGLPEQTQWPRYPFVEYFHYVLSLGVGAGSNLHPFDGYGSTPLAARDYLKDNLERNGADIVIVSDCETETGPGVIVSPVCWLSSALIRLRPPTHKRYPGGDGSENRLQFRFGSVPGHLVFKVYSASVARDHLLRWLEQHLSHQLAAEAVGDDSLIVTSLAKRRDGSLKPVAMAVLNVDSRIDIVGAPALILKTEGLSITPPREGFCVLRNEAEFLINVPGQWGWRPGLRRERGEIPRSYRELADCFGDSNTEIFYGSSNDPALMEYWTPAGTFMATYTRMTTMEAANESGRHAAAAVVYKILADSERKRRNKGGDDDPNAGLVANFPMVWRIEDYEYDDLKFAKDLDAGLFAAGLPHALDILGVTDLVNRLLAASVNDPSLLTQATQMLRAAMSSPQMATIANLQSLAANLRSLFPGTH